MSEQLIIAGFHRSGTSLTAQLLAHAGLFLGERLLEEDLSNKYGHFEDVEVKNLHGQILSDCGLDWRVTGPVLPVVTDRVWSRIEHLVEKRCAEHRLWGFKDPRACLFLPIWKYMLPDAKVLAVYRNVADSTHSLKKRHSTQMFSNSGPSAVHRSFFEDPDLAPRMWLAHNREILTFASHYPEDTMVVSLDMIQDAFPLVWALNKRWHLGLRDVSAFEVFDAQAISSERRKSPVRNRDLADEVDVVERELERLSSNTEAMLTIGDQS